MQRKTETRHSPLAGLWYPGTAKELQALFASWQEKHKDVKKQRPSVLLLPHAGYAYCGNVLGAVLSSVDTEYYERVFILSPCHYAGLGHTFSVAPVGEVITPLGAAVFDEESHNLLAALPYTYSIAELHAKEHSIDVLLPCVQYFFTKANKLGALMCGQWLWDELSKRGIASFAKAFRGLCNDKTLLIISTDFTHYGRQFGYVPFTDEPEKSIHALDQSVYEACAKNDGLLFAQRISETKATVCGSSPLQCLLAMLPASALWEQVAYTTSGALSGNFTHSVSYLGAMVFANWEEDLQDWVQAAL